MEKRLNVDFNSFSLLSMVFTVFVIVILMFIGAYGVLLSTIECYYNPTLSCGGFINGNYH